MKPSTREWLFALFAATGAAGSLLLTNSQFGPQIEKYLGAWGQAAATFLVVMLIEYLTGIRNTTRWENAGPQIMNLQSAGLIKRLDDKGVKGRLNIMMPRRHWSSFWVRKKFQIVWQVGMDNHPDAGIELWTDEGVVGACWKSKSPRIAPPSALASVNPIRRQEIQPLVKDIQFVISYPIFEPASNGTPSGRLMGVFSLDSRTPGAWDLIAKSNGAKWDIQDGTFESADLLSQLSKHLFY